jgi:tetrahydromethanopterin S-methyltransferase subunit G
LVLFAIFGASALYGSPRNWTFAAAKSQAIAGLASAVDVLKAPLEAITGRSEREQERSQMRDLSAALTQVTIRLDRIEHEYGASLDRLGERIDQDSSARSADIAARLDKLEKKTAAPATPASEFAEVVARLDKLEKRVALAAAPASELADITTRLNKLEKRVAVTAAISAKPLPPATPKQSMLMARAEPSASNEIARPDSSKPLLRDYSVEDVQDGVAVVDSRYGQQQVAPGDFIPGAGRVLRIERRGGDWVVLTSLGVIASGAAPY